MDVDSTLIQQEVIELLAEEAGVLSEVKAITDQAMQGELDFAESLHRRVALLENLPESVVDLARKKISLTPGAKELIDAVHGLGGKVGAVSGGFTQVLDPLATEIGLDFWKANQLESSNSILTGRVIGDVVDADAKADALRMWSKAFGSSEIRTIAIGDGANDIQMLVAADYAVAFRPKSILREYADLVIEENSLLPVIQAAGLRAS